MQRLNQSTAVWLSFVSHGRTAVTFSLPDIQSGKTAPTDYWFDLDDYPGQPGGLYSTDVNSKVMPDLLSYDVIDFSSTDAAVFMTSGKGFFGQVPHPTGRVGPRLATGQLVVPPGDGDSNSDENSSGDNNSRQVSYLMTGEGRAFAPTNPIPPDPVTGMIEVEALVTHEFGHLFGLEDTYALGAEGTLNDKYDLMNYTQSQFSQHHFLGYWLEALGYLEPSAVTVVPRGSSGASYSLTPAWRSSPGSQSVLIKVPLGPSTIPFRGYYIEARMLTTSSEAPPTIARDKTEAQGVVVTRVDETVSRFAARAIKAHSGVLLPGTSSQFSDPTNGILIDVVASDGDGFEVEITIADPNPSTQSDPLITPWQAAIQRYESVDIWINSDANDVGGVVTYRDTDTAGNPVGNGDPPFVGAKNTVFARISNGGFATASNVAVEISWAFPVGAGDGATRFDVIGMSSITIPAGGEQIVSAELPDLPASATAMGHGCIRVRIAEHANEVTSGNNEAQENVFEFLSSRNSPFSSEETTMRVHNPLSEPIRVFMVVNDLPSEWAYALSPEVFDLAADSHQDVTVRLSPGGTGSSPSSGYDEGGRYDVAVTPVAVRPTTGDNFSLGGVNFVTRLVFDTTSTVFLDDQGSSNIQLRACVAPVVANVAMSLQVESPKGMAFSVPALTDSSGCVTHTVATSSGTWRFHALFVGSDLYGSSRSSPLEVVVP